MAGGDAPVPAAHVSARENRAGAKPGGDAPVPAAQACGHMTPCACHCAACRAAGHGTGMCLHLCARLLALTEGNQDVVDLILRRYRGCGLCNGRAVCLKEDPVRSVCYDPRGDVLAAGDGGGRIHTLCAQTGQSLSTVSTGNADWVMCLQWNHAGSKLASGSDDKTVKIWSARGEDDILECQATFRGHTRAVCGVAWNATDSILASCSLDTSVRLWNSDTGAELPALCGHGKAVSSLAFKPNDPEILVTGSWDRTLKCWNVSTGECLCTLMTKHTDWIMTVAWSWDGTKLASGSRDKTVKVWSRGADDKFECQSTLSGHTDSVRGVAFHPTKDHVLVSCSLDTKIILWNMDTGAQLAILEGHTGRVQAVAFKNDGTQVASASWDKTARIWDLQGGMQLAAKAHSSLMEEEDRGSDKKAHACAEPKR